MKAFNYEQDLVLERLPGLFPCNVRDSATSFFSDYAIRSFPAFWFLLSLLCLYTWLSLVSFLAKWMDSSDNAMVVKRSLFSRDKVAKSTKGPRKSFDGHAKMKMQESLTSPTEDPLLSPLVTLIVGRDQRLFVAHENILSRSPFFDLVLRDQFPIGSVNKALVLSDEEPEVLSCFLEFLYKGDYTPRLQRNKSRKTWELESFLDDHHPGGSGLSQSTIFHSGVGDLVLRDTAVYCAAEKYGLEELKDLALRKQGLQTGIPVEIIIRSARYAYDNTPDSEYRLRAHYLAMMIRTRDIFKRSGTMQFEMEMGHKFFFDLFVAMCNHMDDLGELR
ncbi:hypothetical protein ASPSYDRAFT_87183 [Aspergillus sydowii CBS 593.65]|uniref:BTB domain-containing protein n=1 Tax=Aspergillus sydowii CBS 593.65 TaxID=1036612 RepID=A0A1L9TME3_9EURO|nr:uncharacterized protein ASPSYDRAFT_87183 [Aspergillus sydowii CBS 593.65]OJJ60606.1 hypothetical protein ASPSYDRAFT_87183 [Aspergillus sydowii CBS 593.65]